MADEETPCEGLAEGVQCISGMLYRDGCKDVFWCNGACEWVGYCSDPRHNKKETVNAESQA